MNRREREKKKIRYANSKAIAEKQQRGFDLTSFTLPKGVKFFQFKEEKVYRLVIIPFEAKHNPNCDAGEMTWERTYFVHPSVGPDNKRYACPFREANKKCPVHDEANRLRKSGGDSKLIYNIERVSKRQLIGIFDLENKSEGIQVYEGPYFNGLGEIIDNKIDATDDDSPYRNFFHLDSLMKLLVKSKKDSFQTEDGKGGTFFKPVNVEMEPLKSGVVPEEVIDSMICLDDCVKVLDYADLKKIFLQVADSDDEEEQPKSKRSRDEDEDDEIDSESEDDDESSYDSDSDSEDEDEDEEEIKSSSGNGKKSKGKDSIRIGDYVNYDGDECEVKKVNGNLLTLESESGEVYSKVKTSEVSKVAVKDDLEDDEDSEEEERTSKKKRVSSKVAMGQDDEDENDEPEEPSDLDDEEDDSDEDSDLDDEDDDD